MKSENLILALIISLMVISMINILIIFYKNFDYNNALTGEASYSSYVNITLISVLSIDFERSSIDWGSGQVDDFESNATLYTNQDYNATVLRGNWSNSSAKALILNNVGNVNCSLSIKSEKNAADFFSSWSGTNQEYKYNVSNRYNGSCGNLSDTGHNNVWSTLPKDPAEDIVCREFSCDAGKNSVYIDVLLTVPSDANKIGEQNDTIVVTASSAD